LLCGIDRKAKIAPNSHFLIFFRYLSGFSVEITLYVRLQSDGAKPYALLFTQQGINFFFAFFATWRFIPKDQVRIYRMIRKKTCKKWIPATGARKLDCSGRSARKDSILPW